MAEENLLSNPGIFTSSYRRWASSRYHARGVNMMKDWWGFGEKGVFTRLNAGPGVLLKSAYAERGAQGLLDRQVIKSTASLSKTAIFGAGLSELANPAFIAWGAYSGYKRNGVKGALTDMALSAVTPYVFGTVIQAAIDTAPVTVAAIGGFAAYKLLQHGNATIRRIRRSGLSGKIIDPYGNTATMRQRSLMALSNSQLNGKSAFGSEASFIHLPYMRG